MTHIMVDLMSFSVQYDDDNMKSLIPFMMSIIVDTLRSYIYIYIWHKNTYTYGSGARNLHTYSITHAANLY